MIGFILGAFVGATLATIIVAAIAAAPPEPPARDVFIEDSNGRVNATLRARVLAARRAQEREFFI